MCFHSAVGKVTHRNQGVLRGVKQPAWAEGPPGGGVTAAESLGKGATEFPVGFAALVNSQEGFSSSRACLGLARWTRKGQR